MRRDQDFEARISSLRLCNQSKIFFGSFELSRVFSNLLHRNRKERNSVLVGFPDYRQEGSITRVSHHSEVTSKSIQNVRFVSFQCLKYEGASRSMLTRKFSRYDDLKDKNGKSSYILSRYLQLLRIRVHRVNVDNALRKVLFILLLFHSSSLLFEDREIECFDRRSYFIGKNEWL